MIEHTQYDKPGHILEERPGLDPNQYMIPFKLNQYPIKFPTKTELPDPSELEKEVNK
ncbi:hypothetical protein HN865_05370 [Candidatus Woesearchaeota archaeon]|jgi:hypothetical protein|nr:hypothetical protein [Candidatus Woesearchaeota archaeon]MBT7238247.1 hypothetical protein [Candidatus Woesearchaeota archaeon]